MQQILEFIVLGATGLFAGAAVYVSAVEHPARMSLPIAETLAEFRPSYRRGAAMQASLAMIGGLGGLAAGIAVNSVSWVIGGALLLTLIPYTIIAIMPTSHRLMDAATPLSDAEATNLLRRWGHLHAVRTVFGLSAFVVMLVALFST